MTEDGNSLGLRFPGIEGQPKQRSVRRSRVAVNDVREKGWM